VGAGPRRRPPRPASPGRIEAEDDATERKAELSKGRPDNLIPLRRPGAPADVADVIVALAGPQFRYVTGQTVHVTGGFYMGQ
jgi:3-oxoacyl-[acyl-carrier protein] reductase